MVAKILTITGKEVKVTILSDKLKIVIGCCGWNKDDIDDNDADVLDNDEEDKTKTVEGNGDH